MSEEPQCDPFFQHATTCPNDGDCENCPIRVRGPSGMHMDIYDTVYSRLLELIPDLREMKVGDARVSKSSGFMDLHLDVLDKTEKAMRIALHHSFEQNGDLVSDPDMEIRVYLIDGWKKAEALTYQDQFKYQVVYDGNLVNVDVKKQLNSFLAQWLKNCIDQGHKLVALRV